MRRLRAVQAHPVGGVEEMRVLCRRAQEHTRAALGRVLYTQYFYFFQAAGMILLTAMIGAIVLTLRHRVGIKRQNIAIQVARDPASAVELRKVPSRVGI